MSPASARRRAPVAETFRVGPFSGVRTTVDPLDDDPSLLYDAINLYIPDPEGKSGAYALPGFSLQNGGLPLVTSATPFRGQGGFSHTSLAGVTTNFAVMGGKLFRVDGNFTTFTDVTPVGATIDAGITTRVYGTSFADSLIVTDGVNTPWLATNLTSTPITATLIDFDGSGTAWSAFGPFVIYVGSALCILNSVGGVSARTDIAWSLPADPAHGWQQPDFDFRWTLEQTASDPLYGLATTNTQVYYWREGSIGSLSGTPGPNFQGQATHDAISQNVGTLAPQTIVQFGNNIFFADALGRPYLLSGGQLTALWLNLRAIVDTQSTGYPGVNKTVATAAFEPTLNLYIVAPWSALPSQSGPATEGYCFDARTGRYFGRFSRGGGIQLETLCNFIDGNGRGLLVILGSAVPPTSSGLAVSGFLWSMNSLSGVGDFLTTEGGVMLTTESGVLLTTEGTTVNWTDNGQVPVISATPSRMGYDPETVITVDVATALVGTTAPCTISLMTASVAETTEGVPTPSSVQDGVSRLTVGSAGMQGRGVTMTISPTTATEQWSFQMATVRAVVNLSPPDEP